MSHQAYPLCWPIGWPKTEPLRREQALFKTSLAAALHNLKRNVTLLGGKDLVLSSNYTLGNERPKEPGVVAYFAWQELQVAIPCDRWRLVEHNVQAITLTIEAMRGMERWGAKHMIKAMFTGFKALPEGTSRDPWWTVLGLRHGDSVETVKEAYRTLAKAHHPDVGGDPEAFRRVTEAYDSALAQLGEARR